MSMFTIDAIAKRVATQPNDCTAEPYFVVEERVVITGLDTAWVDEVAWIDEEGDLALPGSEDFGNCEMQYQENHVEPECWTRTGIAYRWEAQKFFLTKEAAQHYIATKSHHHRGALRVYTDSAHDNPEIRALRAHLLERSA